MDARPDRFTAFLDANVLVPALHRNVLLSLAAAGLYRPRWSKMIIDEMRRALVRAPIAMTIEVAERQCREVESQFQNAAVTGYEALAAGLVGLPDPDDAHVIAASKHCGAAVIVTDNLRHFPASVLEPLELEAKSADAFIADTIDLDFETALDALARMGARFRRPALTPAALLDVVRARGLPETAEILAPHLGRL